jgi:hypothetical protein
MPKLLRVTTSFLIPGQGATALAFDLSGRPEMQSPFHLSGRLQRQFGLLPIELWHSTHHDGAHIGFGSYVSRKLSLNLTSLQTALLELLSGGFISS